MSAYARGAGGVSFDRQVVIKCLTHMLTRHRTTELGGGHKLESVAFQQASTRTPDPNSSSGRTGTGSINDQNRQ